MCKVLKSYDWSQPIVDIRNLLLIFDLIEYFKGSEIWVRIDAWSKCKQNHISLQLCENFDIFCIEVLITFLKLCANVNTILFLCTIVEKLEFSCIVFLLSWSYKVVIWYSQKYNMRWIFIGFCSQAMVSLHKLF